MSALRLKTPSPPPFPPESKCGTAERPASRISRTKSRTRVSHEGRVPAHSRLDVYGRAAKIEFISGGHGARAASGIKIQTLWSDGSGEKRGETRCTITRAAAKIFARRGAHAGHAHLAMCIYHARAVAIFRPAGESALKNDARRAD